jgi:beta-lactamase regulating signal transducer with metallopeptidase domain/tetratricopeptide (TPR) repeat protein
MDPFGIFRGWLESISGGALLALLIRITLLCVAGQVALLLLRKAPAAVRHLAATTALAALVLAPVLFALLPAWPALRIPIAPPPSAVAFAERSLGTPRGGAGLLERTARADVAQRPEPRAETARAPRPTLAVLGAAARLTIARVAAPLTLPLAVPGALALLLMAGAELLLLLFGISSVCAAWLARRARVVDRADILAERTAACRRVGLAHDVPLRVSGQLSVPVVVGILRPCLLLPLGALDWPAERRQAVLVHELAHVARRDGIAQLLARLATALYWFHPLAWRLARAAHDECERAADDTVLRTGVRASDYAEHLLAVARDAMRAPLPRAALAFARPSSLEGRLVAILEAGVRRDPAARHGYLWAALTVAAFILPLTSLRVVACPRTGSHAEADGSRAPARSGARTASASATEAATERATATATASAIATATATATETHTTFEQVTSETKRTCCSSGTKCTSPGKSAAGTTTATAGFDKQPEVADSKSGENWYGLAHERYRPQRFIEAAEAYENAARRGYRPATAWYNSACSWSLAGKRDAALGALLQALDSGFDDLDLVRSDDDLAAIRSDGRYQLLLERALRSGSTDSGKAEQQRAEARSQFDALAASDTHNASQWRAAGLTLLRSGEPDRAAQAFEAEFKLDSSASGLYNVACAQARGDHPAAALATLERAVLMGYGDAKEIAADADLASLHADPAFDRTLQLADDLALFSNGRGDDDTPAWRRDLPRFERVTRGFPEAGRAWFNLGYAELRVADLDGSARSFSRALELGYRAGTTSYNLACVAARRGDVDGAFRWLERAESAGMAVGGPLRTDRDLVAIRSDARYRAMLQRWEMQRDRSGDEKAKAEKEKEKQKGKSAQDVSGTP